MLAGAVEPQAVSREHRPVGRPDGPNAIDADVDAGVCRDEAKAAGVAVPGHERVRRRRTDAEDENEPRERLEEPHRAQDTTGTLRSGARSNGTSGAAISASATRNIGQLNVVGRTVRTASGPYGAARSASAMKT